jgi:50S ribosomal protein L16 3-hydroxylase
LKPIPQIADRWLRPTLTKFKMNIQELFGNYPLSTFVDQHLHRLPLALPGVCQQLREMGTWPRLAPMLTAPDADLMLVQQGARYTGPGPTDVASAQALCASGCTILIRHAERHDADIARLADVFCSTFRGPVNVHAYATPPNSFGFSWHYDAEDVFIIQTTGEKEYLLRKNTVNPWPLEETIPEDMRYERELMPLMRVFLRAGDMLYIPCGYWHRAQAAECEEVAISLAVGVMSQSAVEIFDLLRNEVLESLVWRQRLPLIKSQSVEQGDRARQVYEHLLEQLATDISGTLTSRKFLSRVMELTDSQSPSDRANDARDGG